MTEYNKDKVGEEKRRFLRLNINTEVEYSVLGKESLQETDSTKNISAGGICIIVYEEIDVDTVLSLTIHLPGSDTPIQTKARVVWKSDFKIGADSRPRYDVGIEFLNISEEEKNKISQYVFAGLQRRTAR